MAAPQALIPAGTRFGSLVVLQRVNQKSQFGKVYRMLCDCGNRITVPGYYCTRPERLYPKRHCGADVHTKANTEKHVREKGIWRMMHQRCYNPNHVAYQYYGGRGIGIYTEWHESNPNGWQNFIAYIGAAPSTKHSIDRYPDNNKGYIPGNVRWATAAEQRANQRPYRNAA